MSGADESLWPRLAQRIGELRAKIFCRQWDGRFIWARIVDGPLAGIQCRICPEGSAGPAAIMGWCCVNDRGPVVAFHVKADTPGEWLFRGYERPGGYWYSFNPKAQLALPASKHDRPSRQTLRGSGHVGSYASGSNCNAG
jgi:hypothetical protein